MTEAIGNPGRIEPRTWSISQAEIDAYADLSGANDPLHVDPEYARATPFGSTIAQGLLTFGRLAALLEHVGRAQGAARRFRVAFKAPVKPGCLLSLEATPLDEETATAVYAIEARQADGSKVIVGDATILSAARIED